MEDNIKMDIKQVWYEGVDLIQLAQDGVQSQALMNTVLNLWVP